MNLKEMRDNALNAIKEKSPEILVGVGLAGMLTSTVLAVKATPKAVDILREEEERHEELGEDFTTVDKIKKTWKLYLPAAVGYCSSAACIIAATSTQARRHAILAGAYKLSESAFIEYKNKVVETVGEEKEKEIRDSINARTNEQVIACLGKGEYLCCDHLSGRYFRSSIDKIEKAVNNMNYKLLNDNIISLNEFYYELGIKPIDIGYEQGWDISKGMIEVSFGTSLSEDDEPCIVMYFDNVPQVGFDKFM